MKRPRRPAAKAGSVKIVVTGSTGFIGRAVVRALAARGDAVTALSRTPQREAFDGAVTAARFDPNAAPDPAPFEGADAVVHLAGESVAGRWTPEKKRAINDSRVAGTRALVASLAPLANIEITARVRVGRSRYLGNPVRS